MRKLSLRALGFKKAVGVAVIRLQQRELKASAKGKWPDKFYDHGNVRHNCVSINVQQDATTHTVYFICELLYMFRVASQHLHDSDRQQQQLTRYSYLCS